ncbi:MAG: BON domain-containing protein [Bryobacterales bacterium]|nr:BON domain-containing protein [Bryobacterales bacterium]
MRRTLAVVILALSAFTATVSAQSSNKADDKLYDQVRLRLAGDPMVNGGALEVDVKDGAVTLRGKVRTDKARERAEKLAKKVKGVKSVTNEIKIDTNAH